MDAGPEDRLLLGTWPLYMQTMPPADHMLAVDSHQNQESMLDTFADT